MKQQEILRTPYLTRHRTGQVERLMACDQIEAKIMKYHYFFRRRYECSQFGKVQWEDFCSLQDQIELLDR